MRHLIIPDVHLRHEIVERIITAENPEKIIFLGDYFDDFNDTAEMVADTADWLKESINKPNRIHLVGNHDISYWFKDNKTLPCAGYEQYKSIIINDFLEKKDWEKLKFFHVLDNQWLLSHGGLHPTWTPKDVFILEPQIPILSKITGYLNHASQDALIQFSRGLPHWFGAAGFSRSRSGGYGGLLWNDWSQEFMPMKGIHQIVGHTPTRHLHWVVINENTPEYNENDEKSVMTKYEVKPLEEITNPTLSEKNSYNICLDCRTGSKYYAIYDDVNKSLTIKNRFDLHS